MTDNHNQLRDQYRSAPYVRSPETLDNNILREAAGRANLVSARNADKLNKQQQKQSSMRDLGMAFSCLLCVGLGFMLIREPATEIIMPAPPLADTNANIESNQANGIPSLVVPPPSQTTTTQPASQVTNSTVPTVSGVAEKMSVDSVEAESATVSSRESAVENYTFDSDSGNPNAIDDSTAAGNLVESRSEPTANEISSAVITESAVVEEAEIPQVQILEEQVVQVKPAQAPSALPAAPTPELTSRIAPPKVQPRVPPTVPPRLPPRLPPRVRESGQSQSGQPLRQDMSSMAESRIAGSPLADSQLAELETSAEERADVQAERRVDIGVSAKNKISAEKHLAKRSTALPAAVRIVSLAALAALPQDNYTIVIAESDNFQALGKMVSGSQLDNDIPSMQLVNMADANNLPRWLLLYGSYESLQMASEGVRSVRELLSLSSDTAIKPRLSIQQYSTLR